MQQILSVFSYTKYSRMQEIVFEISLNSVTRAWKTWEERNRHCTLDRWRINGQNWGDAMHVVSDKHDYTSL